MKNWFNLILIMALINMGCSAQKNSLISNINSAGNKQLVEDSVLQKLQADNSLIIAYAVENFAWVRSIHYNILTQNNNEWKGYVYHKNLMPGNAGSPTTLIAVPVSKTASDSLLNYITVNKAWEIKGDGENGFCADSSKKCNIYDASSARLWMITKNAVVNPVYYAPEFYEECCPDKQRGLFLSITKKVAAIIYEKDNAE